MDIISVPPVTKIDRTGKDFAISQFRKLQQVVRSGSLTAKSSPHIDQELFHSCTTLVITASQPNKHDEVATEQMLPSRVWGIPL